MTNKLLSLIIPGNGGTPSVQIQAPEGIPSGPGYTIGSLSLTFIYVAMIIGIFLSLGYLVYGGIFWIQASGDKQKWDKARRIIVYSVVGLILMSTALVIVNVISAALGVHSVTNSNP